MKSSNQFPVIRSTHKLFSIIFASLFVMVSLISCGKKAEDSDPTTPVRSLLEAQSNNDFDTYKKQFYYEPDSPLTDNEKSMGVISLSIKKLEVSEAKTKWFSETYTNSELAKKRGWNDHFISGVVAVMAEYSVDFDNTKVPFQEGDLSQTFYVVRESEDSPWLILDAESPH
jgi:hypothetical protein